MAASEAEVYDRLRSCNSAELDAVVIKLGLDRANLPGAQTATGSRAAEIWYMVMRVPDGLGKIERVLAEVMAFAALPGGISRREVVSVLLDLTLRDLIRTVFTGEAEKGGRQKQHVLRALEESQPPPSILTPEEYLDLILLRGQPTQLIPSHNHPLLTHGFGHPDDLVALQYSYDYLRNLEIPPELVLIDEPGRVEPDMNHICYGAPVSHEWTKLALGYEGERLDLRKVKGPDLRYQYIQSEGQVEGKCKRYEGNQEHEVPNWAIETETGPLERYVSRTGAGGFLEDDYLLITRIPSQTAGGRWTVVIGGAHGLATRAFSQLLTDRSLVASAARKIEDPNLSFQSLFLVAGINHDHQAKTTSWSKIEHIDTVLLGS